MAEKMYDLTDAEEESLPLPDQWTRGMDLSGEVRYKNLKFGSESEEHPYIIQALNAARRQPLPPGWVVRKTVTAGEGSSEDEDFFFHEASTGRTGWDPPLLRECLCSILRRDGFADAAERITLPNDDSNGEREQDLVSEVTEESQDFPEEELKLDESQTEDEEPTDPPPASVTSETVEGGGSSVDWSKLRANLSDFDESIGQGGLDAPYDDDNEVVYEHQFDDDDVGSVNFGGGRSQYPSSVASTKSRRSQKWLDIQQHQREKKTRTPVSSVRSVVNSKKRNPAAITQQSVRTLAASVLEDNEKVHILLMELRGAFADRKKIPCNFLHSNSILLTDSTTGSGIEYSRDSVESLLKMGGNLTNLVVNQPDLVVRAISTLERQDGESDDKDSEVDLMVYIVLHRILHPFSSDNSRTTALLLESLNLEIDRVAWDPDDFNFNEIDSHSAADTDYTSWTGRIQRRMKHPVCNEQHALLCMLLLGVKESKNAPFFWKPLHRPFLRDYTYNDASQTHQLNNMNVLSTPDYHETILTSLLKCYAMRRDVSLFYRMIWRQVIPAMAGAMEGTNNVGPSNQPKVNEAQSPPMSTFSKLISLASRIIESALLDEVGIIFPATATAMVRCLAETCGNDGMYTYLLNYLLLPNLVKLLLGDNDCAENEDTYDQVLLISLANKYFNYHEWWPKRSSFVENRKSKKIRIVDIPGVLIWCVWRIFTCAVFTDPSELPTFSAAKFFEVIEVNETFTEVADTRIRNVVNRMHLKIKKGCKCLLQLPLDIQASNFLEEEALNGDRVQLHTKAMGTLLNKRINDLMLKPQEMTNGVVISRHDAIIVFDALAYFLETSRNDVGTDTDDDDSVWQADFEVEEVLLDIQDFLSLCDSMDDQIAGENGEGVVEDIMLLWSEPPPRHDMDNHEMEDDDVANSSFDGTIENSFDQDLGRNNALPAYGLDIEHDGQIRPPQPVVNVRNEETRGGFDFDPPPHMLPSFPYEDDAYQSRMTNRQRGIVPDEFVSDNGVREGIDMDEDDGFLDDVTMFSDIPPPPPDGAPWDSVEYQHDQLCRGNLLQQRYIASLSAMLKRIREGSPCTLTSLLKNDMWYYSPEVDISNLLAVHHHNIFDKSTSSTLIKSKRNCYGAILPQDLNSRIRDSDMMKDYTGLAVTQKNFFDSLRFSDARPRANTRTSVDINMNRDAPRLVNNMIRETLITKHDPDKGFHEKYEKIYHDSHGRHSDPVLADQRARERQHKPRYTKVTLPENSSLLVPTVSLCCKPTSRQPHSKIHNSYIKSLRSPDPKPKKQKNTRAPKQRTPSAAISPNRPLVSFPEHLRGRVRHDLATDENVPKELQSSLVRQSSLYSADLNNHADYYEQNKQSGKNNFHGETNRLNQYGQGKYYNNNIAKTKCKERKMPTPLRGSHDNLLTSTISHSMKLEDDADFEITAEQEKGWMAQLRSWEAMDSQYQGRIIAPVLRKPFFPSGHVAPVRLRNQQRRIPEHLTPGKNREDRRKSKGRYTLYDEESETNEVDWYDYRDNDNIVTSPPSKKNEDEEGIYTTFDEFANANRTQFNEKSLNVPDRNDDNVQENSSSPSHAPVDTVPTEENALQLDETLKLLVRMRTQTQNQEKVVDQAHAIKQDESSLSSVGTILSSPEKSDQMDPSLRDHVIQTESVLERLQRRLDHQKAMKQQPEVIVVAESDSDSTKTSEIENDENNKNVENDSSDVTNSRYLPPNTVEVVKPLSIPPRPPLPSVSSSYSLQFAETESPLKEKPRRLLNQEDPPLLTPDEEKKLEEEFEKHQRKSELLSPTDLRNRVVSKTMCVEDEHDINEDHTNESVKSEPSTQVPIDSSSPGRAASSNSNQSSKDNSASDRTGVPLIQKQHSLSNVAKREKLIEGYEVTKHSDVGFAKKKLLSYEPSSQSLRWRALNASVFSRFSNKPQQYKSIHLHDIIEVRRGIVSSALRKAGLLDPLCCLSILTNQEKDHKARTLDVVFHSKSDRDSFVRALEITFQQLSHHSVNFL